MGLKRRGRYSVHSVSAFEITCFFWHPSRWRESSGRCDWRRGSETGFGTSLTLFSMGYDCYEITDQSDLRNALVIASDLR